MPSTSTTHHPAFITWDKDPFIRLPRPAILVAKKMNSASGSSGGLSISNAHQSSSISEASERLSTSTSTDHHTNLLSGPSGDGLVSTGLQQGNDVTSESLKGLISSISQGSNLARQDKSDGVVSTTVLPITYSDRTIDRADALLTTTQKPAFITSDKNPLIPVHQPTAMPSSIEESNATPSSSMASATSVVEQHNISSASSKGSLTSVDHQHTMSSESNSALAIAENHSSSGHLVESENSIAEGSKSTQEPSTAQTVSSEEQKLVDSIPTTAVPVTTSTQKPAFITWDKDPFIKFTRPTLKTSTERSSQAMSTSILQQMHVSHGDSGSYASADESRSHSSAGDSESRSSHSGGSSSSTVLESSSSSGSLQGSSGSVVHENKLTSGSRTEFSSALAHENNESIQPLATTSTPDIPQGTVEVITPTALPNTAVSTQSSIPLSSTSRPLFITWDKNPFIRLKKPIPSWKIHPNTSASLLNSFAFGISEQKNVSTKNLTSISGSNVMRQSSNNKTYETLQTNMQSKEREAKLNPSNSMNIFSTSSVSALKTG
ncbi:unnamed protein product [Anisakis simplex]|uniref:Protein-tyrosine-phosphatase n=1 Tax=Anisakis simplex TaxID=6269 RepID=A0A0M3KB03_ANISI|nr:unnamed protein product [Anisakis simplex]